MALQRQWTVVGEFGEVDVDELNQNLVDAAAILRKCGGFLQVGTIRKDVFERPGEKFTEAVIIRWLSRDDTAPVPEARAVEEPAEESAEEPAPVTV